MNTFEEVLAENDRRVAMWENPSFVAWANAALATMSEANHASAVSVDLHTNLAPRGPFGQKRAWGWLFAWALALCVKDKSFSKGGAWGLALRKRVARRMVAQLNRRYGADDYTEELARLIYQAVTSWSKTYLTDMN